MLLTGLPIHRMLLTGHCFAHLLLGFLASLASGTTTFHEIIPTRRESSKQCHQHLLIEIEVLVGNLVPLLVKVIPPVLLDGRRDCPTPAALKLVFFQTFMDITNCLPDVRFSGLLLERELVNETHLCVIFYR
ncbi:hypothetical protein MT325_m369L [Paramecium bursaria chlorella virus MT325]|uniref:Uncharacterized protein m369L n=1 Tax=Paramecium bursaria Chlorella virus MT325 TaxID=346932 RepID=A7IU99_PBCVM|nr:hypothetical protein MT325_m369L [Paramecium bursaria chlorella virus MT325]